MLACRVLGHRYRFSAAGRVMRWHCERGCGAGGSKAYSYPAEATMFAAAFDRDAAAALGRRAPLVALLPLRLWRAVSGQEARRRYLAERRSVGKK